MWIDAHCHLADPRLRPDLEDILTDSRKAGVTAWLQGGIDRVDWEAQLELRRHHGNGILPVFGLHPWAVANASMESELATLKELLPQARAVGETGLDAHPRHAENLEKQKAAFREHLDLARKFQKPLVLHVVRAHEEALQILEAAAPFPSGGIVHSFSGAPGEMKRYVALGFLISLGGSVTHPDRKRARDVSVQIPGDSLCLETDAPDQAPAGVVGLNSPGTLVAVAEAVASLRGVSSTDLLNQCTQNIVRVFGAI